MKYKIEKNTVQETLIIPLYGRKICSEKFPDMFLDEDAENLCNVLDYDFESQEKFVNSKIGMFGAMEVAQRHLDLIWEIEDYLKAHPKAAVVNLGCGLDGTFKKVDNGQCRGYNIDLPDIIEIRNQILPAGEREENIGCDLNDETWMDFIDDADGAVFFAAGVFYYFETDKLQKIISKMARRFKNGVVVFDACNKKGTKMMTKKWLKDAGITDIGELFHMEDEAELNEWSNDFKSITAKSYMRGYNDIYKDVGLFFKFMIKLCDNYVKMKIVKIQFK